MRSTRAASSLPTRSTKPNSTLPTRSPRVVISLRIAHCPVTMMPARTMAALMMAINFLAHVVSIGFPVLIRT